MNQTLLVPKFLLVRKMVSIAVQSSNSTQPQSYTSLNHLLNYGIAGLAITVANKACFQFTQDKFTNLRNKLTKLGRANSASIEA
jgi:hypothetical protein